MKNPNRFIPFLLVATLAAPWSVCCCAAEARGIESDEQSCCEKPAQQNDSQQCPAPSEHQPCERCDLTVSDDNTFTPPAVSMTDIWRQFSSLAHQAMNPQTEPVAESLRVEAPPVHIIPHADSLRAQFTLILI